MDNRNYPLAYTMLQTLPSNLVINACLKQLARVCIVSLDKNVGLRGYGGGCGRESFLPSSLLLFAF